MGLFLVVASVWTFLLPVSLERAYDICEGEAITKECYLEALEPIEYKYELNE